MDRELARRGLGLRGSRLTAAAARIASEGLAGVRTIWLDGFHALPDPELAVIAALGQHAELTLTLDEAELGAAMLARPGALDSSEERARGSRSRPAPAPIQAPSTDCEGEEIAQRILHQADAGRPSEFGEPCAARCLRPICAPRSNASDSRAILLRPAPASRGGPPTGAIDAMLGGWDHAATLAVVRLAPRFADFGVMDRFDSVRERIPQAGLTELRSLLMGKTAATPVRRPVDHKLDSLKRSRMARV